MRPARIFLGTPIRTYKCIYKGTQPTRLLTPLLIPPARTPNLAPAAHIYVHYMGRPAPLPAVGWWHRRVATSAAAR